VKDFFIRRAKNLDLQAVSALLETAKLPLDGFAESCVNFFVAEGKWIDKVGAAGLEV
jgi:N-acetylglutamate synthase-like GNAT family acetyltransferase